MAHTTEWGVHHQRKHEAREGALLRDAGADQVEEALPVTTALERMRRTRPTFDHEWLWMSARFARIAVPG